MTDLKPIIIVGEQGTGKTRKAKELAKSKPGKALVVKASALVMDELLKVDYLLSAVIIDELSYIDELRDWYLHYSTGFWTKYFTQEQHESVIATIQKPQLIICTQLQEIYRWLDPEKVDA